MLRASSICAMKEAYLKRLVADLSPDAQCAGSPTRWGAVPYEADSAAAADTEFHTEGAGRTAPASLRFSANRNTMVHHSAVGKTLRKLKI